MFSDCLINCYNSWPNSSFEQDPYELVKSVRVCLDEVASRLQEGELKRLKGIGISNQRETTILWDKKTGKKLHNAIGETCHIYLPSGTLFLKLHLKTEVCGRHTTYAHMQSRHCAHTCIQKSTKTEEGMNEGW